MTDVCPDKSPPRIEPLQEKDASERSPLAGQSLATKSVQEKDLGKR